MLDADLSKSTNTALFEKNFPDRYFEAGIAEQNMVSIGVGLSLTGKIVFLNSFAVFLTGRAYDQVRVGVALGKASVKLIGSSAGLSDYDDGATHQSIEEIKGKNVMAVLNFEPRQVGDTLSEVLVLGVQLPKTDSGEATFITPFKDTKLGSKLF